MNIGQWIKRSKGTGNIYVVDTDRAWEANDPGGLDMVTVSDCDNWDDVKLAVNQYRDKGTRDDWLVVDMIDRVWTMSQEAFTTKAFGEDVDEFFLRAKKDGFNPGGDHGTNWGIINKMYNAVFGPLQRFPGHVIACTGAEVMSQVARDGKDRESPESRAAFGRYGVKPTGQKALAHGFHSVLLCQEKQDGWVVTSVKDRNRERVAGKRVENFAVEYLVEVGGWCL